MILQNVYISIKCSTGCSVYIYIYQIYNCKMNFEFCIPWVLFVVVVVVVVDFASVRPFMNAMTSF